MSLPSVASGVGSPAPVQEGLSGRGLLIARVVWVALTVFLLGLGAASIPGYFAVLQAVCQHGAQCNRVQLRPDDVRLLHQLGLSPAFRAAWELALAVITTVIYTALAALIFWRRSDNRMALFCAYMLVLFGNAVVGGNLEEYGLGSVSPVLHALVAGLATIGAVAFITYFFLFPSGRFVPRWTRWFVPIAVLLWVWNNLFPQTSQSAGNAVINLLLFALLVCAVAAQIYRYRRVSTPRERLQTKWVVYGFSIGILAFVLTIILGVTLIPASQLQSQVGSLIPDTIATVCFLLVPISIAIAILRSRLYDIDRIINRTLVYSVLTVILAAVYAGLVLGLQVLLGGLLHLTNGIALVVSTLAIAALFHPLRRRIQNIIDRRFYRRKYDAARTLAAFSASLRNEVDLEQLSEQLVAVVEETMQPAHVSLWLRKPEREKRSGFGR
jgi:hypothetical protein